MSNEHRKQASPASDALASWIDDDDIRELHNGYVEGTANDAIGRHLCYVALGERCIEADAPVALRYPTRAERAEARSRLVDAWNFRRGGRRSP